MEKFKEGDKVVCVSNKINGLTLPLKLSIDKIYTVESTEYKNRVFSIVVNNDNGVSNSYFSNLFIELSEYRNNVVENILK